MGTTTSGAPSGRTHTFDRLVAYFDATRGEHTEALRSLIGSRYATPDLVDEALAHSARLGDAPGIRAVRVAAVSSPHLDPERLYAWVLDGSEGRCDSGAANAAAANPLLGPDAVAELWEITQNPALLANPHIGAEVLVWTNVADQTLAAAAANPAAPEALLREAERWHTTKVLQNPACPRDILEKRLERSDATACFAIVNPQLSLTELTELRLRELERLAGDPGAHSFTLTTLERAIDRHLVTDDPLAVRTLRHDRHIDDVLSGVLIDSLDVIDPLDERLTAGDGASDALQALLRTGFDGTVAELLHCATEIAS